MKLILSFFFVLFISFSNSQSTTKEIIKEMSKTIEGIETLQYDLFSWESFGKKTKHQIMFVKLRKKPFEVYVKTKTINNGAEMLYSEKQKKATINPNKRISKNIKVEPTSKIITNGMHHTLFESGFDYFNKITKSLLKEEKNIKTTTKDTTIDKKEIVKVTVLKKEFKLKKYKIKPKETLRDICLKKNINTYFVYRTNKKILKNKKKIAGETILIPNTYAEKIELYIEKKRKIPVQINVYMEKKLFEKYIFKNIQINPKYNKNEITLKNKEYGF